MDGLEELKAKHSIIGNVRGLGLMCGMELVKDRETREHFPADSGLGPRLTQGFAEDGLFLRGGDLMNIMPPLCVTPGEIEQIVFHHGQRDRSGGFRPGRCLTAGRRGRGPGLTAAFTWLRDARPLPATVFSLMFRRPVASSGDLGANHASKPAVVADGHDGVLGLRALDHGGAGGDALIPVHVEAEPSSRFR